MTDCHCFNVHPGWSVWNFAIICPEGLVFFSDAIMSLMRDMERFRDFDL